jgi:Glyoxalase-like domain
MSMARSLQIVIDCAHPDALSRFWAEALGYILQPPPEGFSSWEEFLIAHDIPFEPDSASAVVDPDGTGPRFYFQRVPEPKTAKNRMHVDLNVAGREMSSAERTTLVDAEVDRLIALGANKVRIATERGEYWTVMQDPEGNEFCVQ